MAEYISRDKVLSYVYATHSTGGFKTEEDYLWLQEAVVDAATADVQPVDRWISVDESLPVYDGLVLIYYNDKTIRLAIYTEDGWYSDEGEPIMEQPDYWSRIPESPKTKKRVIFSF